MQERQIVDDGKRVFRIFCLKSPAGAVKFSVNDRRRQVSSPTRRRCARRCCKAVRTCVWWPCWPPVITSWTARPPKRRACRCAMCPVTALWRWHSMPLRCCWNCAAGWATMPPRYGRDTERLAATGATGMHRSRNWPARRQVFLGTGISDGRPGASPPHWGCRCWPVRRIRRWTRCPPTHSSTTSPTTTNHPSGRSPPAAPPRSARPAPRPSNHMLS